MKKTCLFLTIILLTQTCFCQFSQTILENKIVRKPINRIAFVDSFNKVQPLYASLTNEEKEIVYYINVARSQPKYFWDSVVVPILTVFPNLVGSNSKSLYKDLMQKGSLPMFSLHHSLMNAAKFHSDDMAKTGLFSHSFSNGTNFIERLQSFGIKNTYAAENISMGQQSIIQSIVLLYLDIGIPDLGHRKTLLSTNYTLIGVGYTATKDGSFYITQDFSSTIY